MLKVRQIKESDWDTISSWTSNRDDWKGRFPDREFLPESGLGGVIVSNDSTPFAVGFLYFHPNISFIEWIMSDVDYKEENRGEGIRLVIEALTKIAQDAGAKSVISITQNKNLINRFKDSGFIIDDNPSHECIKVLR